MARDLAAEIEAELEAGFGEPAAFIDFVGEEYERVRFRLAGERGERTCAWHLDDDQVALNPKGGSATMNRQMTALRSEQRPAPRLRVMTQPLPTGWTTSCGGSTARTGSWRTTCSPHSWRETRSPPARWSRQG